MIMNDRSEPKRRNLLLTQVRPIRLLLYVQAVFLSLSLSACSWEPLCQQEIVGEIPSPDNEFKAVVFHRDGGAFTPCYLMISILHTGEPLPDAGGNIYCSDDNNGKASDKVWINWLGNRRLQIFRDPKANVDGQTDYCCFTGMFHRDDFKIEYADYPQSSKPEPKGTLHRNKKRDNRKKPLTSPQQ